MRVFDAGPMPQRQEPREGGWSNGPRGNWNASLYQMAGYVQQPDGTWVHPQNVLGSGKRVDHYFTDLNESITGPLWNRFGVPPWGTYLLILSAGGYLVSRARR
jgi:hypothetical protein